MTMTPFDATAEQLVVWVTRDRLELACRHMPSVWDIVSVVANMNGILCSHTTRAVQDRDLSP